MLSRAALEESPLADLHVLASELGIDGFRRLRKADLIDRIIESQGGEPEPAEEPEAEAVATVEEDGATDEGAGDDEDEDERPARRRGRRGGRGRSRDADRDEDRDEPDDRPRRREGAKAEIEAEERVAEGTIELLGNGSGFLRVSPPDPSDDDVYVSAAQVRRCELVSGDKVTGPVRAPRRSERYPSLVRVDTINGRPADEVAEGTHFDDLPCEFPSERFALGADDPTLKAIEWLTPLGRGSRVALCGEARSGKSEALRRLAVALNGQEAVDQLSVVLAGVRPEELALWKADGVEPVAELTLSASADAQAQAVERAVETARRVAARGGHAVVVIDTLDGLHAPAARRALGAARNITGGGSLTVIATTSKPLGGETTVIAFDRALTSTNRFPALDLAASGTLRPELLVGQAGADAIAQARSAALGA
jgi:transcription termination factor Rho